jgi:transcriptional regulator with XRE-family HTH domain
MTPEQLRQLRDSRGLTREQLAKELSDCSASTINKWERGINPIPAWVEEKMLRNVPLTLPIEDLQALMDLARESGQDFSAVLGQALRDYLKTTKPKPKP